MLKKILRNNSYSKKWSFSTLFQLSGEELLQAIYVSDSFPEETRQSIIETILLSKKVEQNKETQPSIIGKNMIIYLRPTSPTQMKKINKDKVWTIDHIQEK